MQGSVVFNKITYTPDREVSEWVNDKQAHREALLLKMDNYGGKLKYYLDGIFSLVLKILTWF